QIKGCRKITALGNAERSAHTLGWIPGTGSADRTEGRAARPARSRSARKANSMHRALGLARVLELDAALARAAAPLVAALARGGHEAREERGRRVGAALELGVELTADEVRVVRELDHLHEALVRAQPA